MKEVGSGTKHSKDEKVLEPEEEAEKSQWRKNDAKTRRILIDSVKDHLLPQISEKKTTKKMFYALKSYLRTSMSTEHFP